MLHVTAMPMPGALRLRALHPLIEGDGSCSLIYDLERAAVVEVPEELQFHVAPALETGDLDEALLGWLVNEDLLTGEGGIGWSDTASSPSEVAGWWTPGALYRIDDALHARIDHAREEAALEIVGFIFKQSFGNSRVKLHLSWGGAFPGTGLLERIVIESSRLGGMLNQEISYELTLDAEEVTPPRADFLASYSFQVRLICGSFPAPRQGFYSDPGQRELWAAEPAARLLVHSLGDRLTVCCTLDRGRLLDCWEWAKQTGVRHLDTTVLDEAWGHRRELRNDLLAICDEMADELAAQRLPIDYKPLTRIVDRLMRSEPLDQAYGERGSFGGLVSMADVYPRAVLDCFPVDFSSAAVGAGALDDEPPCQGCWARHVCSHSALLASSQPAQEEEPMEISEERCSLWRTEVEVALRFYHRLAHTDPMQVRRFFDDSSRELAPGLGLREDLGHLRMPF